VPSNHDAEHRGEPSTAPTVELAWIEHKALNTREDFEYVTAAIQCIVNWVMDADVELHGCVTVINRKECGKQRAKLLEKKLGMERGDCTFRTSDGDEMVPCVLTRQRWSEIKKEYGYTPVAEM
jgi:hypothetical protein